MTKKTRVGRDFDASAVELLTATAALQSGQKQMETLRRDCQLQTPILLSSAIFI